MTPDLTRKPACPIEPLAYEDGRYYVRSVAGEFRALAWQELAHRLAFLSLTAGDPAWWCTCFPVYDDLVERSETEFNVDAAARWLMAACTERGRRPEGSIRPADQVRRPID